MILTIPVSTEIDIVTDFDYEDSGTVVMSLEGMSTWSIAQWLKLKTGEMLYVEAQDGRHCYMIAGVDIEARIIYIVPYRMGVN